MFRKNAPDEKSDEVVEVGDVTPLDQTPEDETAVEVRAQTPSNESTVTPMASWGSRLVSLPEAALRLVELVEQHRTAGDADVAKAVADVRSAVAESDEES